MKNLTLAIAALALLALSSCTQKPEVPQGMFLIKGTITNVPDSSIVELFQSDGRISQMTGQDTIINGKFEFSDSLPPSGQFLTLNSPSDGFPSRRLNLWVESQTYIEIEGDGHLIVDWDVESTLPRQQEESQYIRAGFPEELEYDKASVGLNRYQQMMSAGTYDSKKHGNQLDSIFNILYPLSDIISIKELEYLRTAPVTEHWLYSYSKFSSFIDYYKREGQDELAAIIEDVYKCIPEEQLKTELGEFITAGIFPPTVAKEGDDMVDGILKDTEGNDQSLSQFKGKYIVLDFWSAGCGPCIAAIPEMKSLADKYDNAAIVSISIDNKTMWDSAIKAHKLDEGYQWNELNAKNTLYNSYDDQGAIPFYVIISPDDKVAKKWSGYFDGCIEKRLKEVMQAQK
ncbi:MAG: TlpA disulfide reductase family protein [Rikenellaceae bacterium]